MMSSHPHHLMMVSGHLCICFTLSACDSYADDEAEPQLAEGIFGLQGEVLPSATAEQRETFKAVLEVAKQSDDS